MGVDGGGERQSPSRRPAPRRRPAGLAAVVVVGGLLLVAYHGTRLSALGPADLHADLGIQHYLARITARGAVPLVDFEHGWNTAWWYFSAGLYRLAGGNATLWWFLWAVVFGPLLAGLLLLGAAWRLRLPPAWTAALLAGWVATVHLPQSKYTFPMAWMLVLLPVGAARRDLRAVVARVVVPATVFWFHVELAILLGAGTAMYDLFGAREGAAGQRLTRVAAVGVGLLLGAASQVAVYAAAGIPPGEILRQVLVGQTGVYDRHFGYPILAPGSFRMLVYPATLVLPFVPAVWRRLSDPTRYVAFLHLSQALIGIRRPGDGHVGAAATLLALLAALVVWDLSRDRLPRLSRPDGPRAAAAAAGALAAGAGWYALAVAAGFRVASLLAIVALSLVCLAGVLAARGGDRPWASVGAVVAAVGLLAAGLVGRTVHEVRADEAGRQAEAIAAALEPAIRDCLPGRRAWVVPGPLMLYDTLDLENPTPFFLFWYPFEGELDRVRAMIEAGAIPGIVTPSGWPESMAPLVPFIEERYDVCAEQVVPDGGMLVRVWRQRQPGRQTPEASMIWRAASWTLPDIDG